MWLWGGVVRIRNEWESYLTSPRDSTVIELETCSTVHEIVDVVSITLVASGRTPCALSTGRAGIKWSVMGNVRSWDIKHIIMGYRLSWVLNGQWWDIHYHGKMWSWKIWFWEDTLYLKYHRGVLSDRSVGWDTCFSMYFSKLWTWRWLCSGMDAAGHCVLVGDQFKKKSRGYSLKH